MCFKAYVIVSIGVSSSFPKKRTFRYQPCIKELNYQTVSLNKLVLSKYRRLGSILHIEIKLSIVKNEYLHFNL